MRLNTVRTSVLVCVFIICTWVVLGSGQPTPKQKVLFPAREHLSECDDPDVCNTHGCHAAADELLASMNLSAAPCTDFYAFACGGWQARHPLGPGEERQDKFNEVKDRLDGYIRALLESGWSPEEPAPVRSAQDAYAACADEAGLQRAGLLPLVRLSNQLGSWPMATQRGFNDRKYDPFDVVADMTRLVDLSPLISVFVGIDAKDTRRRVVTVDQSLLSLDRSTLLEAEHFGGKLTAYVRWISATALALANAAGVTLDRQRLAKDAVDVVAFELRLANITTDPDMQAESAASYLVLPLSALQDLTDELRPRHRHASIDWLAFVRRVFVDVDVDVAEDEPIVIGDDAYLRQLLELLDRTPARVVANYVQWCLVSSLVGDTTKEMRSLAFDFNREMTGTRTQMPRWKECVTKVTDGLGHAVGYKYVHTFFDLHAKQSAKEMVDNIRAAFTERLEQVVWMDDATKAVALEKAAAMTEQIGYPDWYNNVSALLDHYKDLNIGSNHFANTLHMKQLDVGMTLGKLREPVDPHEWITSPETVNAFYSGQTNAIIFPAGILQPPLYSDSHLVALKYGAIGFFIGHEITHGFDDHGRLADKHGNLAQWWSPQTDRTYMEKAACFVRQYAAYHVDDELTGKPKHMNGVVTQGENIADNGGLNTAFRAYRRHVRKNGPELALPGLKQFSPEQLFFVGFASTWCETISKETLLRQIVNDNHLPKRFRILGTLSNSREFAHTFHCPLNSEMNPQDKCRVW